MNSQKSLDCGGPRITLGGLDLARRPDYHCIVVPLYLLLAHKTYICVPEAIFFPTLQWKSLARFENTDNGHFLVRAVITHMWLCYLETEAPLIVHENHV